MDAFLPYSLWEAPKLEDGHTFSASVSAPRYRVRRLEDRRYPPDSLFHNPFGFWELRPA